MAAHLWTSPDTAVQVAVLTKVVFAAVVATTQDRPPLVDGEAAERALDLGQG